MLKNAKRPNTSVDVGDADVTQETFIVQFDLGTDPATMTENFERVGARAISTITQPMPDEGRGALVLVEMKDQQPSQQAIDTLSQMPGVTFAELNATTEAATTHQDGALPPPTETQSNAPTDGDSIATIAAISNDAGYSNGGLWNMYGDKTAIANQFGGQAGEAWAAGYTGSMKTVVGVIDSGVDYTHPDLYLNIWLNQGEISSTLKASLKDTDGDSLITFRDLNNVANKAYVTDINNNGYIDAGDLLKDARWADGGDQDNNGFKDDLIGWDFANNDNDPFDDHGHGTHVSGTIGAMGGNGVGVVGVDWNVQLVAMKTLGANGSGLTSNAIQAVNYFTMESKLAPTSQNFVATNNSWTSGGFSQALSDAVTLAAKNDILFIASAGNSAVNTDVYGNYPSNLSTATTAGYDAVISVASLTDVGGLSSFSNYGAKTVDLAAPGSAIYSTLPGGGYGTLSGTSMAAPLVTGAAALYASAHPDATAAEIKAAILATTNATASLAGKTVTGGRLDIGNLLNFGTTSSEIIGDLTTDKVLVANAARQSAIDVAGDQDWFRVNMVGGYRYDFAMDAATGSNLDPSLCLRNAAGTQLAFNDDAVGKNSRLSFTTMTDGTFFISAQAYKAYVGGYTLSMTATQVPFNLVGGSGNDVLTGGSINDTLTGLDGRDTLDGGLGADTMIGGVGDDVYYVDHIGDKIVELRAQGVDTVYASVSYRLGDYVEKLNLAAYANINGTGGIDNNVITASYGKNIIDGGLGADTMAGGADDDAYYVDNAGDIVIEARFAGDDSVFSSISYKLTDNVETLTLTGSANINGAGNGLFNKIYGNAGNNVLDGGAACDTMYGGAGNDTYIFDNNCDDAIEYADQGIDTVMTPESYFWKANIEILTLTGSGAAGGFGDGANNVMNGNSGANTLWGYGGNDSLSGGAGADNLAGGDGNDTINGGLDSDILNGNGGADIFIFNSALGPANIDSITGFSVVDDTIWLDRSIFSAIANTGALTAGAFNIGAAASEADDRIIFNSATGGLFYDADGNGKGAAIQFATLSGMVGKLSAADFMMV